MGIETLSLEYVLNPLSMFNQRRRDRQRDRRDCLSQRHFRLGAIGADNKIGRTYDRRTEER